MTDKEKWKNFVQNIMQKTYSLSDENVQKLAVGTPPKPEMGDLAFPLFPFSKITGKSPVQLASELMNIINSFEDKPEGQTLASGPYLNVRIGMDDTFRKMFETISFQPELWGKNESLSKKKVMVEFSCPNTNKPLHLGHVRNDCLGLSVSRILQANGAEVKKVNLINNRGVHICKSMLAYQKFGNGETPESMGIKGDHFVGKWYVRFSNWEKEDCSATEQAQNLLVRWEAGDPAVLELWKKMNSWAVDGIKQTYSNMGVDFDFFYYESDTYKLGKDIVLEGLKKGVFQKQEDGAVYIDNSDINLDRKILLRKDGTSIYITQDIGTAVNRHNDWPFDSLVYVVASEQQYHFKVLFHVLEKLGYSWAENLYHLSYGMVFLPDGRMKSREGTVVDADDLLESLTNSAKKQIQEKGRDDGNEKTDKTAHNIALGALNYYMLQFDPSKDVTFIPEESLSFNGNTGPYLQYVGARICSMLKKFDKSKYKNIDFNPSILVLENEHELLKLILSFPEVVKKAGEKYDPSLVCSFLYTLSKKFSRYYHDTRILDAPDAELVVSRIRVCEMVLVCLKNAFYLLGIPFLEKM